MCQAEDGIRDLVRSRGLGDVYKRQGGATANALGRCHYGADYPVVFCRVQPDPFSKLEPCLLYTSDAADERSSVDLGGRRIIKKKNRVKSGGVGVDQSNQIQHNSSKMNQKIEYTKKTR